MSRHAFSMGGACVANSYSALFLLPENVNGRHRMKKSVGKNHMYIELWFANYAVVCSSYVWLTADEFQIFKHENFVCPCFPAHVFHRIKPRMKNSQHLIEVDQADTGCSLKIVFFFEFTACRRTTHHRKRSECTITHIGWQFLYSQ